MRNGGSTRGDEGGRGGQVCCAVQQACGHQGERPCVKPKNMPPVCVHGEGARSHRRRLNGFLIGVYSKQQEARARSLQDPPSRRVNAAAFSPCFSEQRQDPVPPPQAPHDLVRIPLEVTGSGLPLQVSQWVPFFWVEGAPWEI